MSKASLWYSASIGKVVYYTAVTGLLLLLAERMAIVFSYEAHTAGIDNNFDYGVIRLLAGQSLYPDPAHYPYSVNPYTPVFFIVCQQAGLLLHISADDTISVFHLTRAICLLADIGTGIWLFHILKRLLNGNSRITICLLFFFFLILCFLGYTINRSDSLFLFFYSGTLFLLLSPPGKNRLWILPAMALFSSLCIYSKQNGIILLLLVPAWMLYEKKYRKIIVYLFFAAIFAGGLFVYFEYFYTRHFFSEHIINALKNRVDPRWFYVYVFKLMASSYLTLPLSAAFVIAATAIIRGNSAILQKIGWLFCIQLLFSTALAFKWGSSQGYYDESFLTAFIVMAACLGVAGENLQHILLKVAPYTYPALLLLTLNITAQLYFFYINSSTQSKEKFAEQQQISNYLKKEIAGQEKYVLDLSNADFNFFKTLLYKEAAAPNIDAVNCCTLPDKIFDYSGLLNGLHSGKVVFLIENKDASLNSLWNTDISHYKKDRSFPNYTVYRYDSAGLRR